MNASTRIVFDPAACERITAGALAQFAAQHGCEVVCRPDGLVVRPVQPPRDYATEEAA